MCSKSLHELHSNSRVVRDSTALWINFDFFFSLSKFIGYKSSARHSIMATKQSTQPKHNRAVDSDAMQPRKRRRLSIEESSDDGSTSGSDDAESDSASGVSANEDEPDSADSHAQAVSTLPTSTVSRIKAKSNGITPGPTASIKVAVQEKSNFAALNVDPWLVHSLGNMAIRHPTGIQQACIPEILKGRDCIGGSRTGSGKTVAFAVPILQEWARNPSGIFAVVLTPTRYVCVHRHHWSVLLI